MPSPEISASTRATRTKSSSELAVLAGLDAAAELVDVGERLPVADEGVRLGEQLVLEADAGEAALAQLAHEAADVVEVAVAGVAVDQDRQGRGVGHVLEHVQHLGPRRLVAVAQAERGRHREARRPDPAEARLLDDLRGEAVMGLQEEGEGGRADLVPQRSESRRGRPVDGGLDAPQVGW
jgi:GNAT superfamily N-acetyltransferase